MWSENIRIREKEAPSRALIFVLVLFVAKNNDDNLCLSVSVCSVFAAVGQKVAQKANHNQSKEKAIHVSVVAQYL